MSDPSDRGWGPGWPNCQKDKLIAFEEADILWRMRSEIEVPARALVVRWHDEIERLDDAECGSFACRAKRKSKKPSLHSWGLAFDFNTLRHPFEALGTWSDAKEMQILALLAEPVWDDCWEWGGTWTDPHDPHHVQWIGTPEDAVRVSLAVTLAAREDPVMFTARHSNGKVYLFGAGGKPIHLNQAESKAADEAGIPRKELPDSLIDKALTGDS